MPLGRANWNVASACNWLIFASNQMMVIRCYPPAGYDPSLRVPVAEEGNPVLKRVKGRHVKRALEDGERESGIRRN